MNDCKHHDIAVKWVMAFPSTSLHIKLISSAAKHAENYMSQSHFDSSHDFKHIGRVVALAGEIFQSTHIPDNSQLKSVNSRACDPLLVILGALLHDVGDRKYSTGFDTKHPIEQTLQDLGADQDVAHRVQTIVHSVSYSFETANPGVVQSTLELVPELAIVQDADRLDAIGAVGIGRCFTFSGSKKRSMEEAVKHFSEKLLKLEGMMKTSAGKTMARDRSKRLETFINWWNQETLSNVS